MQRMIEKRENQPGGLTKHDTLEDALKRADELARPDGTGYSGMMIDRKDLRRVVLLGREFRRAGKAAEDLADALRNMVELWERIHPDVALGRPSLNQAKRAIKKFDEGA